MQFVGRIVNNVCKKFGAHFITSLGQSLKIKISLYDFVGRMIFNARFCTISRSSDKKDGIE